MWRLVTVCLGASGLVLASTAICLIRLLPSFWHLARRALQAIFILSFRLYEMTLSRLAPIFQRLLNIDLLDGWPRVVACMCLSLAIGLLILWSSWGFLKRTMDILLEATPENIDFMEVKKTLEGMEHIDEVHDLHIWTITSGMPILSAHINLSSCCSETSHWQDCLGNAQKILKERFGIEHTTLQVEPVDASCGTECQLVDEEPE